MDKDTALWVLIAAVILLFIFGGTGMGGYGMMGFGMGFGFIFMLLFWGAIIWLVVTLVSSSRGETSDALTIIRMRYAKGEITKKQFGEMKKEIKNE